jgi:HNH endonuclease/AP2 domain
MAPKTLPPRELLRQLLDYDPATGIFTWKPRPREMFATKRGFSVWNARFTGKPAGGSLSTGHVLIRFKSNGGGYLAHRLAWLLVYGEPVPPGIDHWDCNPLNNRISNLRAATQSQNTANAGMRSDNSTGAKGVRRHKEKYTARITCEGTNFYLGIYDTVEEAAAVYREAAIRLYGKFARW